MTFSVRRVYWPTQETVVDYLPSSTNSAGSFDVATPGVLVCGRTTKTQTLLWTTSDLWAAEYVGLPFIYAFRPKGKECGIVGQNAVAMVDESGYWMGYKKFLVFDGFVKTLDCEVTDYVFNDFSATYAYKVFAYANPQFSEVTWHYPSSNATECDRYVTYDYAEGHWVFGTLARSCAVAQQAGAVNAVPVLIDSQGRIYDHETGNARSSAAYLESGPIELGEGDNVVKIQRIVPDDKTAGDVNAYLYTSLFPNGAETLNGPYTLASPTSLRLTARQCRLRLVEVVATSWRVGVIRLGAIVSGRR